MTIKICGITREADYRLAAELGADFIGFVFHRQSPRYINPLKAAAIGRELGGNAPLRVGVFVNEAAETINRVVEQAGLDLVQLHGEEGPTFHLAISCPCWKALRIGGRTEIQMMKDYRHWPGLLADARVDGLWGGSGKALREELAAEIVTAFPQVIIAGGIGVDTLEGVLRLQPGGIDVSSSLESEPGIKSKDKMDLFFQRYHLLKERVVFGP